VNELSVNTQGRQNIIVWQYASCFRKLSVMMTYLRIYGVSYNVCHVPLVTFKVMPKVNISLKLK